MRARTVYPAIFQFEGNGIPVWFPDLPGCTTCGATMEEALDMARDALGGYLIVADEEGDSVAAPTRLDLIPLDEGQRTVLVEVSLPRLKAVRRNRPVRKTLTLPAWLDDEAERQQLNFSRVLQEALKERLGLTGPR